MDSSFIKLLEYHCDALERALTSLYNLRIILQDTIAANNDPQEPEMAVLKASIVCKQVKEKYDAALVKLKQQISKERENAFTPVFKEFELSVDNCAQVNETCYQMLLTESNLSSNVALSMLAFLSERPLLDVELYEDCYKPNIPPK